MKSRDLDVQGWSTVGAAWENDRGNISIRLNKGVILDWHDFVDEYAVILVPNVD